MILHYSKTVEQEKRNKQRNNFFCPLMEVINFVMIHIYTESYFNLKRYVNNKTNSTIPRNPQVFLNDLNYPREGKTLI